MRTFAVIALAALLTGCHSIRAARQAGRDREICQEQEGFARNTPEYQNCRAALVRKRAEVRRAGQDDATCLRRGYAFDSPEYRQCRTELANQHAAEQRAFQVPAPPVR